LEVFGYGTRAVPGCEKYVISVKQVIAPALGLLFILCPVFIRVKLGQIENVRKANQENCDNQKKWQDLINNPEYLIGKISDEVHRPLIDIKLAALQHKANHINVNHLIFQGVPADDQE
jgi:hypothetical protein